MNASVIFLMFNLFLRVEPVCDVSILNKGIGGNNTFNLIERIESDVIAENPDLVVLLVGTNDMLNSAKMISGEKFRSNIDTLIEILKENRIEVVLMSPPPVDTVYLFERHDRKKYNVDPNRKLNTVSRIMKEKALQHRFSFVDLFQSFQQIGIPRHNTDSLIQNENNSGARDGVHPTGRGYEKIGAEVFKVLLEEKKIKKGMKIICFGDSITYGARVAGQGTASGETYPSYLKRMICQHFQN